LAARSAIKGNHIRPSFNECLCGLESGGDENHSIVVWNFVDANNWHACDAANGAHVVRPIRSNGRRSPCDRGGREARNRLRVMEDLAFGRLT